MTRKTPAAGATAQRESPSEAETEETGARSRTEMPSTRNVDVVTVTEALEPSPGPTLTPAAQISIVVIAFNDVAHVAQAVRSALAQETAGAAVEVIAVDDASTDGTGAALDALAREHPRLRVLHRAENSGGCGTPATTGCAPPPAAS